MDRLTPLSKPDPVVTLDEVKANLRITHTEEDALLARLIASATASLDGRDGALGRALMPQRWRLERDQFCYGIEMPLPPLLSVQAVRYLDAAGIERTVDLADVVIVGTDPAVLRARTIWPTVLAEPGAVAIEFTAGYQDVPEPIRTAIIRSVGSLYVNREASAGAAALDFSGLDPYRQWAFG
ncbi:phage head-tail connector protein [Methylobacterium sp. J-088]|uniref:head-tail connector protein n=1 Tax=Methylobacterium sp. J-088 TaxID=2836664 RepID=UPI001FB95D6B|nr:phage head-tail connector protein [Methylobacterium sp. J-088]MCJ2065045.1 phage head-tail connector protein [Methylobacterium sp. J-088]